MIIQTLEESLLLGAAGGFLLHILKKVPLPNFNSLAELIRPGEF